MAAIGGVSGQRVCPFDQYDSRQTSAFVSGHEPVAHNRTGAAQYEGAIAQPLPDNIDIPIAGLLTDAATTTPVTIGPAILHTKSRPDLSATTTNGNIGIQLPAGRYSLDVQTTNGHVSKDGVTDDPSSADHVSARSTNGNITLSESRS